MLRILPKLMMMRNNPSPNTGLVGIPLDDIASHLGDDDDASVVLNETQAYMYSFEAQYHTL
jgi:hypothetical protein